jgi:hypothetical protein
VWRLIICLLAGVSDGALDGYFSANKRQQGGKRLCLTGTKTESSLFSSPSAWQREPGPQNYSFRDVSYGYDENGDFALSFVITATVHLETINSWTYNASIEIFDADGNVIFTACGRGTATRFE